MAGLIRMFCVVLAAAITIAQAQECTTTPSSEGGFNITQCRFVNGVPNTLTVGENFQWVTPSGVNSIMVTVWGAGGGGSAATSIASGDIKGTTYAVGYTAGGGSGSAIVNYPVSWPKGQAQTITMNIGAGGVGGNCTNVTGGGGGPTTVRVGSLMTLTAYGGGGGGGVNASLGYCRGGGGGGSGGPGYSGNATDGNAGQGGPACTDCPGVGDGPRGGNSNTQNIYELVAASPSPVCSSSAGVSDDTYWVSGGAGTTCDIVMNGTGGSYPISVPCSTQDWAGPCYATNGNCDGAPSIYEKTDSIGGTLKFIFYSCIGAGAPGIGGTDPDSGSGGDGCKNAVLLGFAQFAEPVCWNFACHGESGENGGVIITYGFPPSCTYVHSLWP